MRIISQSGTDYPYDLMNIAYGSSQDGTKHMVFGQFFRFKSVVLAVYSSREKAEKAIEMLRQAYMRRYITNADIPEGFDEDIQKLMKHGIGTVVVKRQNDSNIEFTNLNGYFIFPQEEEIEV